MTERASLLLDCDGLMSNFIDPCVKHINELMGTKFVHDDVDEWDLMKALGVPKDVDDEVCRRMRLQGA